MRDRSCQKKNTHTPLTDDTMTGRKSLSRRTFSVTVFVVCIRERQRRSQRNLNLTSTSFYVVLNGGRTDAPLSKKKGAFAFFFFSRHTHTHTPPPPRRWKEGKKTKQILVQKQMTTKKRPVHTVCVIVSIPF